LLSLKLNNYLTPTEEQKHTVTSNAGITQPRGQWKA